MPKFLMGSIVLLLLLAAAGYGLTTIQARSIPWDCADWQAFAHADRTTSILESLAENRGKTLYCGVDQSDTFTKAETWEAGKDRNERDDTVYFGERGQFRGFIAAQEGYLTDGESGVTGVSIDRIFEFPREERRYKRVKRFDVGTDTEQFPINAAASCGQVLGLICPGESNTGGTYVTSQLTGGNYARNQAVGFGNSVTGRHVTWDTNLWYTDTNYNADPRGAASGNASPNNDWWQGQAAAAAERACRARGARYVAGSARLGPGHNLNRGSLSSNDNGPGLGIFFRRVPHETVSNAFLYASRQSRTWEATCKKVIRRTRK